jgi:hypothetical protein
MYKNDSVNPHLKYSVIYRNLGVLSRKVEMNQKKRRPRNIEEKWYPACIMIRDGRVVTSWTGKISALAVP